MKFFLQKNSSTLFALICSFVRMLWAFIFFTVVIRRISLDDFGRLNQIIIAISFISSLLVFGYSGNIPFLKSKFLNFDLKKFCYNSILVSLIFVLLLVIPVRYLIDYFFNIQFSVITIFIVLTYYITDQFYLQYLRFEFTSKEQLIFYLSFYSTEFIFKLTLFFLFEFSIENYLLISSLPLFILLIYFLIVNFKKEYYVMHPGYLFSFFKEIRVSIFLNEILGKFFPVFSSFYLVEGFGYEKFGTYSVSYKFYEILGNLRINIYNFWIKNAITSHNLKNEFNKLIGGFSFAFVCTAFFSAIYFFLYFRKDIEVLLFVTLLMLGAHYVYIIYYAFYIKLLKIDKPQLIVVSNFLGLVIQIIIVLFFSHRSLYFFILNLYISISVTTLVIYFYLRNWKLSNIYG